MIDNFTERHFQIWLDKTISDADRAGVEQAIRDIVANDPDLLAGEGHSWTELLNMTSYDFSKKSDIKKLIDSEDFAIIQ